MQAQPNDLAKNVYLEQLHDRNEVLYYHVLAGHLPELLPIVYDPTVGDAIEQYSHEYRRPRGIFLSIDRPDDIGASFATVGLSPDDVDLIVCTDAEEILGIGDWGVSPEQAARQVWLIDKQGLLTTDLTDLRDYQRPHARDPGEVTGWSSGGGTITLLDTVKNAAPTILLGTSTVPGAFTREVIETMSATVERPIVFPISNPTSRIEAMPADVIAWSGGKALVAVGIPVGPVEYQGVTYQIGQANNALVYPGLGLGTIVAGASKVTDGMLLAAAEAVAGQVDVSEPGAPLVPPVSNLRASSATTAVAVARAAIDEGVATAKPGHLGQAVRDAMWQPAYEGEAV